MVHEHQKVIHFSFDPDVEPLAPGEGRLTHIGNATMLIEYGGVRILTDPAFLRAGEYVDLGEGATARRLVDPAMSIASLPPIDAILLSHFQGDHFDPAAEYGLCRTLPVVTTRGAVDRLGRRGFHEAHPLDTWQWIALRKGNALITITAMPAGQRPAAVDPAWPGLPNLMGSMLEFRSQPEAQPFRLYISGDTLSVAELEEIPERFGQVDLGIFHLGGARVSTTLTSMDARQGIEVFETVKPTRVIPVHYDDYDVFTSSLTELRTEIARRALQDHFTFVKRGRALAFGNRPGADDRATAETRLTPHRHTAGFDYLRPANGAGAGARRTPIDGLADSSSTLLPGEAAAMSRSAPSRMPGSVDPQAAS